MEVLLREDVENLGVMGDVVDVADGYARNYLLPRNMAVRVTESNLQEVQRAQEARRQREAEELERVEDLHQKVAGLTVTVRARATEEGHLFGSVGAEQIAEAINQSGFPSIRPANILLERHFEEVGEYEVEVMLHPDVRADISVHVMALAEEEETAEQQ